MATPTRGLLFHFTHIDNLLSVVSSGLSCDSAVSAAGTDFVEVGNRDIKDRRRTRTVPISPGGVVADYVPFYFAARSPMLYAIHMGNVPTYSGGQDEVVYLVTSTTAVVEHRLPFVYTDRNAALTFARYSNDIAELDSLVDWQLMEGQWFNNTNTEPDRRERRMAELLVHEHVPWNAILGIAVRTAARAGQASAALASVGIDSLPVRTRADWYF
jgi:ssDNA thymidine ADP-ribosyltransferase, DarT